MKFRIIISLILISINYIKPRIINISKWQAPNNPKLHVLIFHDIHKTNSLKNEISTYKTTLNKIIENDAQYKTILIEDPYHNGLNADTNNSDFISILSSTGEKTLKEKIKRKYWSTSEISISMLSFFKFQNNPLKIFEIIDIKKPLQDLSNINIMNIENRQFITFIYNSIILYYLLDNIKLHLKGQISSENPIKKIINIFKHIGLQELEIQKIEKLIKKTGNKIWKILHSENPNERLKELEYSFPKSLLNILSNPSNKKLIINFLYDNTIKILEQYIQESFNESEQKIYRQLLDETNQEKISFHSLQKQLPKNSYDFHKLFKFLEINALRIIQEKNTETEKSQTIAIVMGHTHCCFLEKYLKKLEFKKINETGINKIKKQITNHIKNKLNQKINNTNFKINNFFNQKIIDQYIKYKIITYKYLISREEIKAIFNTIPYRYNSFNNIFTTDYIITNNIFSNPNLSWAFNTRSNEFEIITFDDFNPMKEVCSFLPDITIDYIVENYSSYNNFTKALEPIKQELITRAKQSRKRKHKATPLQKRRSLNI